MNTCGLITEYNPFHKGHKIHIEKAKQLSGADYLISIMSGSFVQRGEPAIFDKYERARAAVLSGVDLIIELPTVFATANAGVFAHGAINILNSLGIVDSMAFGSKVNNVDILYRLSDILIKEDSTFKAILKEELKAGVSYPKAREAAIIGVCREKNIALDSSILSDANTTLGLEYLTSLNKSDSKIIPYTYERQPGFQASDIRKTIKNDAKVKPIITDDLSEMLQYRLLSSFDDIYDINTFLYNRIKNNLNNFTRIDDFINLLKNKALTKGHIKRALIHTLLNITEHDMKYFIGCSPKYIRVLCANEKGKELLSQITKSSDINIITNPSKVDSINDEASKRMLAIDIKATRLYHAAFASKYGYKPNEYTDYRVFI